jgi:hypothetical protein
MALDRLSISRRLQGKGATPEFSDELAEIIREAHEGELVAKDYLDARLSKLEATLVRWMIGLTFAGIGIALALSKVVS